jgi:hypothetical protein
MRNQLKEIKRPQFLTSAYPGRAYHPTLAFENEGLCKEDVLSQWHQNGNGI